MTKSAPWPTVRLDELLVSPRALTYGIVQPGSVVPDGVPILRVKDIRNGRVDTSTPLRVSPNIEASYERSRLSGGELLVTLVGTVGETAVAGEELVGWNVARAVAVARIRPDVGARWVTWAMKASASTGHVAERVNTTVQTTLNLSDLRDVPVPLPPPKEREAIAATLGALDDKIESNRRAQQLGEQLVRSQVQLLLKNAQGRQPATLGDFCSKISEGVSQANLDSEAAYVGLEKMPLGSLWLPEVGTTQGLGSNKSRFHPGDVLFGKLRPYFKKVAIAPVNGVCSTDILVLRPHEPQDLALVSVIASSDDLIRSVSSSATGTRMPRTSWGDLASWPLPSLKRKEREQLGVMTAHVIEGMLTLTRESHALAAMRDCLLPELLAGRIRVISSEDPYS